ncbi:IS5 family transposase domain protein [Rickettsiales endosymbiont of Paramecium tredecaurelia]|nr:IS5 family transposase domain protein [Candidatus Sarmatiella mevalonica]
MFGIDDSRVCRIIRRLEPVLARVMAIQKDKKLSKKEVESLLIDATERSIERPKKGRKPYYSGKKAPHLKN